MGVARACPGIRHERVQPIVLLADDECNLVMAKAAWTC
jgi:hypothetical protein